MLHSVAMSTREDGPSGEAVGGGVLHTCTPVTGRTAHPEALPVVAIARCGESVIATAEGRERFPQPMQEVNREPGTLTAHPHQRMQTEIGAVSAGGEL